MAKPYSVRRLQELSKMSEVVRKAMGWSQRKLATCVGCSSTTIGAIERMNVTQTKKIKRATHRIFTIETKIKEKAMPAGTTIDEARTISGFKLTPPTLKLVTAPPPMPPPMPTPVQHPRQQDLPFAQEVVEPPPLPAPPPPPPEEPKVSLERVEVFGVDFYAVKTGERDFSVALFSICDYLGVQTQRQVAKLKTRSWASGRLHQMCVRLPNGGFQRDVWMIDRSAVMMWFATINENNVAEELREALTRLQLECCDVLDRYFFQGVAVNPRASEDTVMLMVLEQLKLMHSGSETRDRVYEELLKRQMESTNNIQELTVQVGRYNRINYTAAVGEIANVVHLGDGRFRNKVDGTISLSHQHLMGRIRSDQRIINAEGQFKSLIDDHHTSWLAQLLGVRRVITNLREKGPPLENPEADSLPWKHYRENENDIDSLIDGFYFLLSIGYPSWRTKEQRVVDGKTRSVPYPNLDDARKQMGFKGWTPDQIESNIQGFLMKIPKLGEGVVAAAK